jgi:ABC-type multidrug transport system ATPase subunit
VKTIVDCSKIYVLDRGAIIEQGRFHELKKYKGHEELMERESEDLDSPNLKRHLSFESIVTDKAVQQ